MSISTSRGAYQDCRDLFEKADEDPRGCRVFIGPEGQARFFIMRMHQARQIDRNDNRQMYEFGHPMHNASPWDKFKCSKREDNDGKWWVYVEKVELNLGAVENLSELAEYEFIEPKRIIHAPVQQLEYTPPQNRELVVRRRV